uniref:OBP38 n=1 Tax=Episyrphus balteatus TaxID=286459 RepID=A0A6H0D309_EPIBA|nr:OBP38 [Episyrphus balteatus]
MQYFIIVILVSICGSALCTEAEWDENKKYCSEKLNVNLDEARDAVRGRTKEADVTKDIKCHFLCMGERQKIIKDGVFQPQVFKQILSAVDDKVLLTKATEECSKKGTDDCDTGFKVATCISRNDLRKYM